MRLLSVELNGFRGFSQRREFDLNADAVVIVGANGHGKTSLFDGILWALSGRIPRLNNDDSRLVSMYSETGQARVVLRLADEQNGKEFTVTRSFDGKENRIGLETLEGSFQGPSAEGRLIDLIWPDAASASDAHEAIAGVLTRSIYLQQDLIRQFVEAASDHDRFAAVSELVGAGRVTELQESLERAKKAWSKVTNQRQEELAPFRERIIASESRLSELTSRVMSAQTSITTDDWSQWWQGLSTLNLNAVRVEPGSREAQSAIDTGMKQLDAVRRATERRLQMFGAIQSEIARLSAEPIPDVASLRDKSAALRNEMEELRRVANEEQVRLADQRRQQSELREKNEQLKALAALALKQLGAHCPVCSQTYDMEGTRLRLEALANSSIGTPVVASPDRLTEFLNALAAKEKEAAATDLALRSNEQQMARRQVAEQTVSARLGEAGLTVATDDLREIVLAEAVRKAEGVILQVGYLQTLGESLALRLGQAAAMASIDELRRELEVLRRDSALREKSIAARNATGEVAQGVIEVLREATSAVVQERLREISPLLQSIWARIDPHPAFRLVTFFSQVFRGKGQLSTVITDPIEKKDCNSPSAVLSSSQVNALAVSVFLALNIGIPKPPLSVAMLDDPLQSLDDINLLGLVDLFRQTKFRRQLLISTHDARFGSLLSRKLRPRDDTGRTVLIELDGWSRKGPSVMTREVKCDPARLRLVS